MKRIIVAAMAAALSLSAAAQQRWGVVDFSANYMRSEASSASELVNQALMGSAVEILEAQGGWIRIHSMSPDYTGWVERQGVFEMSVEEMQAYLQSAKYIVTTELTWLYERPSTQSAHVCDLVMGDLLCKVTGANDVRKAIKEVGFCQVQTPSGRTGYVRTSEVEDFTSWANDYAAAGRTLVDIAERFLGMPYFWGGTSTKGVDCSGLTWNAYFMNGIILPRDASQQVLCGVEVPLQALQPGDLLFFGRKATDEEPETVTHVTMFTGDATIIHASSAVQKNSLDPSHSDYYEREVLHARRILGHVDDGTGAVSVKSSPWYFYKPGMSALE